MTKDSDATRTISPMRSGRTTGACAAAAVQAACLLRDTGVTVSEVVLPLPNGSHITIPIEWVRADTAGWTASVAKDGGDDPDVTHGLSVTIRLEPNPERGLRFAAGVGVGHVTLPGLSVPVGEPAINPGPRKMIESVLRQADGGLDWIVTISIPGGAEVAAQTQNARLGVMGGLSVLGTTGIVRPYCLRAQREAFAAQCSVARAGGREGMIFVPGNIGAAAVDRRMGSPADMVLEVGNDWSGALAAFRRAGFKRLLAGGHPGKLAKLAAGDWDTHSGNSSPALTTVIALAREQGLATDAGETQTTEGYFAALPARMRRQLADRLADRIVRRLVEVLPGVSVSVWLCDMRGEELGASGDRAAWGF